MLDAEHMYHATCQVLQKQCHTLALKHASADESTMFPAAAAFMTRPSARPVMQAKSTNGQT